MTITNIFLACNNMTQNDIFEVYDTRTREVTRLHVTDLYEIPYEIRNTKILCFKIENGVNTFFL